MTLQFCAHTAARYICKDSRNKNAKNAQKSMRFVKTSLVFPRVRAVRIHGHKKTHVTSTQTLRCSQAGIGRDIFRDKSTHTENISPYRECVCVGDDNLRGADKRAHTELTQCSSGHVECSVCPDKI